MPREFSKVHVRFLPALIFYAAKGTRIYVPLGILTLGLAILSTGYSQTTFAPITGIVTDPNGRTPRGVVKRWQEQRAGRHEDTSDISGYREASQIAVSREFVAWPLRRFGSAPNQAMKQQVCFS
jgi:hypothetical protein